MVTSRQQDVADPASEPNAQLFDLETWRRVGLHVPIYFPRQRRILEQEGGGLNFRLRSGLFGQFKWFASNTVQYFVAVSSTTTFAAGCDGSIQNGNNHPTSVSLPLKRLWGLSLPVKNTPAIIECFLIKARVLKRVLYAHFQQ